MFLNGEYDGFGGQNSNYMSALLSSLEQPYIPSSPPAMIQGSAAISMPNPPPPMGGGSGGEGATSGLGMGAGTFLSNIMNPSTGGEVDQGGGGGLGGLGGLFGGSGGSSAPSGGGQPSFDYPIYSSPYGS